MTGRDGGRFEGQAKDHRRLRARDAAAVSELSRFVGAPGPDRSVLEQAQGVLLPSGHGHELASWELLGLGSRRSWTADQDAREEQHLAHRGEGA